MKPRKVIEMNPNKADITFVLDRSGSMGHIRDDTIGGFNTFLEEQKKVPGEASVSLFQFDDTFEKVYEGKPIAHAPLLSRETFVPRASTALLDAIGRTIDLTGKRFSDMPEDQRPGKVIFVIITDGEENASREWTTQKVFSAISHQRDVYNWQFVFLGANQDAIATAAGMGIAGQSSMTYAHNAQGTTRALFAVSGSATSYRTGQSASMAFTDDDRKEQQAAGATR